MSYFQAIILGIVQGLTEFLPVSSSGHLVLVPFLLNWNLDPQKAFLFDVLVQLGTLVAVFVYFRQDLLDILKAFLSASKTANHSRVPKVAWLGISSWQRFPLA